MKPPGAQGCRNLAGGLWTASPWRRPPSMKLIWKVLCVLTPPLKPFGSWTAAFGATKNISVQDLIVVLVMDHDGTCVKKEGSIRKIDAH